jgi:hypothetical protein
MPNVSLPKFGAKPPPSDRSFLSFDIDPNPTSESSEYRLRFENYHPKRPYCFHAQPSHVFDYVPMPITRTNSSRLSRASSVLKNTEYQDRYPNYGSFIPTQELLPPHLSGKSNTQSETQRQKANMSRSQYFNQLVIDNEKLSGGQRTVGTSEQRNAFQWPYRFPRPQAKPPQQQEAPATVYPPYSTPRNIYEPLPPIQKTIVNATN